MYAYNFTTVGTNRYHDREIILPSEAFAQKWDITDKSVKIY